MVLGENQSHEKGKGAGDKVMMREPGMAEYVTNSGGTEARGLRELGHLQFFEASLGYMRSCVKTISNKRKKMERAVLVLFCLFSYCCDKIPNESNFKEKDFIWSPLPGYSRPELGTVITCHPQSRAESMN